MPSAYPGIVCAAFLGYLGVPLLRCQSANLLLKELEGGDRMLYSKGDLITL